VSWALERVKGSAASFHARELPDPAARSAWIFDVDAPALVLGSTQSIAGVDVEACGRAGVEVVRRRSGGGAVLLDPGEASWVDLIVPRHDPLWDDDIARATHWVGAAWAQALVAAGAPADAVAVHQGGLVRGPWSDRVCFAGVGPSEVLFQGTKLVGVSQRRTRSGARFQCVLLRHWRPERLIGLLAPPRPTVEDLAAAATDTTRLGLDPALVVDALLAHLITV
jgi:lipoate---protein ligase